MTFYNINLRLIYNLRSLSFPLRYYHKICNVGKRGRMLNNFINQNDKKKHWHTSLMSTPEKNVFDKIHKPARRIAVLNALFVRNITDILSTSDIAPEIVGYGIEITEFANMIVSWEIKLTLLASLLSYLQDCKQHRHKSQIVDLSKTSPIKITSDYQIVNVFWQVPLGKVDLSVDIQNILSFRAPQIRAEMISRNILGKVPKIFFVRDETNLKAAEFEKALLSADLGPQRQENIIPDDEFLKDLFSFKSAQENKRMDEPKEKENLKDSNKTKIKEESLVPLNPADMKSNILGLNHETLMTAIFVAKKKSKYDTLMTVQTNDKGDLFSQVPGTSLQPDTDREKILKQFQLDRKLMIKEKNKHKKLTDDDDLHLYSQEIFSNSFNSNDLEYEPDYFEEENINGDEHF